MTIKRRWFRVRVAFHDWMWGGKSPLHRMTQALPLYFSDPHMPGRKDLERLLSSGAWRPTVGPPGLSEDQFEKAREDCDAALAAGSPWVKVEVNGVATFPANATATTGTTYYWQPLNWKAAS